VRGEFNNEHSSVEGRVGGVSYIMGTVEGRVVGKSYGALREGGVWVG
jgi:hypothetical protein